jgi:hypothetical protein
MLAEMCVRNVERATKGLVRKGVILVFRRGGWSGQDRYEIIWEKLGELEAEWRSSFNAAARARATKPSSPTRQSCRPPGDKTVKQTYPDNRLNRTCAWHGRKEQAQLSSPSSADVAEQKAHERLERALRGRLPQEAYAKTLISIDEAAWSRFVAAEVEHHGAGHRLLEKHLRLLDLELSGPMPANPAGIIQDPNQSTSDDPPPTPLETDDSDDGDDGADGG